jgi:hypothetical protein
MRDAREGWGWLRRVTHCVEQYFRYVVLFQQDDFSRVSLFEALLRGLPCAKRPGRLPGSRLPQPAKRLPGSRSRSTERRASLSGPREMGFFLLECLHFQWNRRCCMGDGWRHESDVPFFPESLESRIGIGDFLTERIWAGHPGASPLPLARMERWRKFGPWVCFSSCSPASDASFCAREKRLCFSACDRIFARCDSGGEGWVYVRRGEGLRRLAAGSGPAPSGSQNSGKRPVCPRFPPRTRALSAARRFMGAGPGVWGAGLGSSAKAFS